MGTEYGLSMETTIYSVNIEPLLSYWQMARRAVIIRDLDQSWASHLRKILYLTQDMYLRSSCKMLPSSVIPFVPYRTSLKLNLYRDCLSEYGGALRGNMVYWGIKMENQINH